MRFRKRALTLMLQAGGLLFVVVICPLGSFALSCRQTASSTANHHNVLLEREEQVCQELVPRGGGVESKRYGEETVLRSFLDQTEPISTFQVQGWRWHTMSLVHEAKRLQTFLLSQRDSKMNNQTELMDGLEDATRYLVDFNMGALHRIENDLFFPWMRRKLEAAPLREHQKELHDAFDSVLKKLEKDRKKVAALGSELNKEVSDLLTTQSDASNDIIASHSDWSDAMESLAARSAAISEETQDMLTRAQQFLIPAVTRLVPERDQHQLNQKVIRSLGVWDARLHLVGMHEAVEATRNETERQLFVQAIPVLPRKLIPRFKRLLYDPRLSILDDI